MLEHLTDQPDGAGLTEICAALNLPKSIGHRLLALLMESGYVMQHGPSGRYGLTLKLTMLGLRHYVRSGLDDLAQPVLDRLAAETGELARLAVVEGERADALVTYDSGGVYPHPDHVHAHRVGSMAAGLVGLLTWYEVTVDREYLHFVDTHVAALAGESIAPMLELGSPTVEITNTVDVRGVLGLKLAAIAEHRTQVVDPTFGAADSFPEVYGYEWFIRHGRPGPIDALTAGAAELRRPAWRRGQTLPVGR